MSDRRERLVNETEELHASLGRKVNALGMLKAEFKKLKHKLRRSMEDPDFPESLEDDYLKELASPQESIQKAHNIMLDAAEKRNEAQALLAVLKDN